jgi:hypothetical protein
VRSTKGEVPGSRTSTRKTGDPKSILVMVDAHKLFADGHIGEWSAVTGNKSEAPRPSNLTFPCHAQHLHAN